MLKAIVAYIRVVEAINRMIAHCLVSAEAAGGSPCSI